MLGQYFLTSHSCDQNLVTTAIQFSHLNRCNIYCILCQKYWRSFLWTCSVPILHSKKSCTTWRVSQTISDRLRMSNTYFIFLTSDNTDSGRFKMNGVHNYPGEDYEDDGFSKESRLPGVLKVRDYPQLDNISSFLRRIICRCCAQENHSPIKNFFSSFVSLVNIILQRNTQTVQTSMGLNNLSTLINRYIKATKDELKWSVLRVQEYRVSPAKSFRFWVIPSEWYIFHMMDDFCESSDKQFKSNFKRTSTHEFFGTNEILAEWHAR